MAQTQKIYEIKLYSERHTEIPRFSFYHCSYTVKMCVWKLLRKEVKFVGKPYQPEPNRATYKLVRKAASTVAGLHGVPTSKSNYKLGSFFFFQEGGKIGKIRVPRTGNKPK